MNPKKELLWGLWVLTKSLQIRKIPTGHKMITNPLTILQDPMEMQRHSKIRNLLNLGFRRSHSDNPGEANGSESDKRD